VAVQNITKDFRRKKITHRSLKHVGENTLKKLKAQTSPPLSSYHKEDATERIKIFANGDNVHLPRVQVRTYREMEIKKLPWSLSSPRLQ
jgi:hypothetical protein